MAAAEAGIAVSRLVRRRTWLGATIGLTIAPFIAAIILAPAAGASPTTALVWLLFVGSSTHIGATAWFYTVPEIRAHMRRHPGRYVWVPAVLVGASVLTTCAVSAHMLTWVLLAFFAWQFFHFQKQNLGIAALAAHSVEAGRLSPTERHALMLAGVGGIGALLGHPKLLQLKPGDSLSAMFDIGEIVFAAGALLGCLAMAVRARHQRPASFVCVYLISLVFFLPVFLFDSPYAAVAGLTIAHGLQYLLLVGLLAAAPSDRQPTRASVLIFVNIALVIGLALNQASHHHTGAAFDRAIYGVYLGVVMTHFVIDAGLWRLRDEFPRAFLTKRLPFLLSPGTPATRSRPSPSIGRELLARTTQSDPMGKSRPRSASTRRP